MLDAIKKYVFEMIYVIGGNGVASDEIGQNSGEIQAAINPLLPGYRARIDKAADTLKWKNWHNVCFDFHIFVGN